MTTIGEFLISGADDLWQRVNKLADLPEDDKAYWLEERELVRTTVRLLRRCDDELTYRLTGERPFDWRRDEQQRIKDAQQRAGEYEREPVTVYDVFITGEADSRNLEVSLAESEAEAEQRRFTERER